MADAAELIRAMRREHVTTPGRCEGIPDLDEPERLCGTPATRRIRFACVHEHMADRWSCDSCATKRMACGRCLETGHVCIVQVVDIPEVTA